MNPPVMTIEESNYRTITGKFPELVKCIVCSKPVLVGETYYLSSAHMVVEPPPIFHVACRKT